MSNPNVYAHEFCTGFRRKLLESIDDPEYVYMLGTATLLDMRDRLVKFMEATWSVELWHEWKWVTTQWTNFKKFFNALVGAIIDMGSIRQGLEMI